MRQIVLLAAVSVLAAKVSNFLVWIPAAIVSGFTIFNFTVLLHEVIHQAVTPRDQARPRLSRFLSLLWTATSAWARL